MFIGGTETRRSEIVLPTGNAFLSLCITGNTCTNASSRRKNFSTLKWSRAASLNSKKTSMPKIGLTYGLELEYGDWDRRKSMVDGAKWNDADNTCVSSTGIANDPWGKLYCFGGEANTR